MFHPKRTSKWWSTLREEEDHSDSTRCSASSKLGPHQQPAEDYVEVWDPRDRLLLNVGPSSKHPKFNLANMEAKEGDQETQLV